MTYRSSDRNGSGKRTPSISLLAALLLPALVLLPSLSHGAGPSGDALILLRTSTMTELWDFVEEWEDAGARLPHVYPPDLLIGDVPIRLEGMIRSDPRVDRLLRKPAGVDLTKRSPLQRKILRSWSNEKPERELTDTPGIEERRDLLLPHRHHREDAVPKGAADDPKTYGRAHGAGFYQTSELFFGRVAVGVILPDTPGFPYADHEAEAVMDAVRGCMEFRSEQVGYPDIQFVYDIRSGVPCSRDFLQTHPLIDEAEWVHEIMENLGFTWRPNGLPEEPVYEYIDSLRTSLQTEWGICMFIPKVVSFPAAYLAYARHGGPYLVSPAGAQMEGNRFVGGREWLSHLLIRETARLFWALDEFSANSGMGTPVPCSRKAGYLAIPNVNSLLVDHTCQGAVHVQCCMDDPGPWVCRYTLGQMGLWDTAENGIPDVLDTYPEISIDTLSDTVTTIYPVINGIASILPEENLAGGGSRNTITFNTIEHVIYRIDDARDDQGLEEWLYADPEGGWGGDSTRVHFSFMPDSLTSGAHTILIRAVNSTGNQSYTGEKRINLYVQAIALHDFEAKPEYEGTVGLTYKIRGAARGAEARLYRRAPGEEEEEFLTLTLQDDERTTFYDRSPLPGKAYTYRLEAAADGLTWSWETNLVAPSPIVEGDYLSRITPNPFRDQTVLSFRVPRGDPDEDSAIDGKPDNEEGMPPLDGEGAPRFAAGGSVTYKQVRVEIDIFNVAGRLVRGFPHVHSYEGFYSDPIIWDGRDEGGRRMPAGVYLVRMKAGRIRETRKVVLLP